MTQVRWERYPLVAQSPHARSWLSMQGNLGLAQNTIEAYGRALEDYLAFSTRERFSPEEASREHIARYVHDLSSRPNPRGANIRVLDTGYGLANATLQQRLTAIRLFYDYLTEEGLCETNPVGRGRYTPGSNLAVCVAEASFRATRNCLGSPMILNGLLFSMRRKKSHCAIGSCWLWPMMRGCVEKSCACWRSAISTRANASSVFVQRRQKVVVSAWFPTQSRRGCSTWPICRSDET